MAIDETPIPPAVCWSCGAPMTDLAVYPAGGPWICLPCKGETLEAARARHTPTPAEPVITKVTPEPDDPVPF
jgi:hypothetical protein